MSKQIKTKEELDGMKFNDLVKYAKEIGAFAVMKKRPLLTEDILTKQNDFNSESVEMKEEVKKSEPQPQPQTQTPKPSPQPQITYVEGDIRTFKDGDYKLTKIIEKGVEKLSWKKIK